MKYLIVFLSIFVIGCTNIQPDTTTVEYGTSENGKSKTQKSIKQTFKWITRLNGINTK